MTPLTLTPDDLRRIVDALHEAHADQGPEMERMAELANRVEAALDRFPMNGEIPTDSR